MASSFEVTLPLGGWWPGLGAERGGRPDPRRSLAEGRASSTAGLVAGPVLIREAALPHQAQLWEMPGSRGPDFWVCILEDFH